jgi:hypothetical protein
MSGFKEFATEIKKLFNINTESNSKLYENTYVKIVSVEEKTVEIIDNDTLTLELKKYSYTAPGKKPVYFYRVIGQFQKNIYYNPFLKLAFDEKVKANAFFSKVASHIQKLNN